MELTENSDKHTDKFTENTNFENNDDINKWLIPKRTFPTRNRCVKQKIELKNKFKDIYIHYEYNDNVNIIEDRALEKEHKEVKNSRTNVVQRRPDVVVNRKQETGKRSWLSMEEANT